MNNIVSNEAKSAFKSINIIKDYQDNDEECKIDY